MNEHTAQEGHLDLEMIRSQDQETTPPSVRKRKEAGQVRYFFYTHFGIFKR